MTKSKLQTNDKIQMTKGVAGVWVLVGAVVISVLVGGWVVLRGNEVGIGDIDETNEKVEGEGDKVPEFALKDYEGRVVSLDDFAGKPLVINSWAVWCPFCLEELDDFAAVQRELKDEVVIIAIDRAEPLATVKKFTDEIGVSDDLVFLLDPSDSFYTAMGGFAMPETLFVRADGTIDFHKRGPMKREEILERIKRLID